MNIEEMIVDLRKPRAARHKSGMKVRNSTWQNLYMKRDRIENEYFHGPIIELGRQANIPVPFNKVALEMVQKCHRDAVGPGVLRLTDILKAIDERNPQ